MASLISGIMFAVYLLLPFVLLVGLLDAVIRKQNRSVNPLTKSLKRPPGTQLAKKLGAEQIGIGLPMLTTIMATCLPYMAYSFQSQFTGRPFDAMSWIIVLICSAAGTSWSIQDAHKRVIRIRRLRLGLECELAVAQELDELMLQGYRVFHDVPADNFNIDHIVVGPNGVFAIETKGRSKRLGTRGAGKAEYKVTYEHGVLKFPGWEESKPLEQARRQALWVGRWLREAAGVKVVPLPVLVLPGWYINIQSKPEIPVLAAGGIKSFIARHNGGWVLSDSQIRQLAYQLDRSVRDLPPDELLRPVALT